MANLQPSKLLTVKAASVWASDFLQKEVSETNIAYLVQYGKIKKHASGKSSLICVQDLKKYYTSYLGTREGDWKKELGKDLNWELSFDNLREKDTTKHVHRLHPYKGKFIPQLVHYFVGNHTDRFKKNIFFEKNDIILDPFSGSGTTLVEAKEIGLHSIGIDISRFNSMIAGVKLENYSFLSLSKDINKVKKAIFDFETKNNISAFEKELSEKLSVFNKKYFPSPDYKYQIQQGRIKENSFADAQDKKFLRIYSELVKKHNIKLKQKTNDSFLSQWYIPNIREEIEFIFQQIKNIRDSKNKKAIASALSRTMRSCRATTHADLGTLKEPQWNTYYCWKHKKICRPLFSIKNWFDRYADDLIYRLETYNNLKSDCLHATITGDSRKINLLKDMEKNHKPLLEKVKKNKIAGIFTSPPYVGQIDYHEQHAYAYDLFNFKRNDDLEIGPLYKGQGKQARLSYVEGVSNVLLNCKKHLKKDFNIFIVANDKYNLYPLIAEKARLKILQEFKRPVLNRTERDKAPYSEIIFHMKSNDSI